jgi:hypothetical protein
MPLRSPTALWRIGLALLAAAATGSLCAQAQGFSILYHERLDDLTFSASRVRTQAAGGGSPSVSLSFAAYGRQFDVELRPNSRLTSTLDPAVLAKLTDFGVYEGELQRVAGSWVRLTRHHGEWSGVISDGVDLYGIEPYARVAPYLATSGDAANPAPVIFRFAETTGRFADVVRASNAASSRARIQSALPGRVEPMAAISPGKQVDIGLVGDFPFSLISGTFSEERLLSLANVVDGIFVTQVGVHLNIAQVEVLSTGDGFTSADPDTLLRQLGDHKAATPALQSLGLVHLLTGLDLTEPVQGPNAPRLLGVANLGSLCDARTSVGLTQYLNSPDAALVMAHEIGHNFGAPHDGESGSPCESTLGPYLMNPFFSNSDDFSQCSLQQMQPVIASASCLYALPSNDVSIRGISGPTTVSGGQTVSVDAVIDSHGMGGAYGISLTANADGARVDRLEVSANSAQTQCSAGPTPPPECHAVHLADGESLPVRATATPNRAGPASLELTVTSADDSDPSDNTYRFDFNVIPAVDLRVVAITPFSRYMHPHDIADVTVDFANVGSFDATQVKARLQLDSSLTILSALGTNGPCIRQPPSDTEWICPIGLINSGSQRGFTMRIQNSLESEGTRFISAELISAEAALHPAYNSGTFYVAAVIAHLVPALAVAPGVVGDGERLEITVQGHNPDSVAIDTVTLSFAAEESASLELDRLVDSSGASCSPLASSGTTCTFNAVASETDFFVRFSGVAHGAGTHIVRSALSSTAYDPHPELANFDYTSFEVAAVRSNPPSSPPASSGGGGGGGALDELSIALLAIASCSARRPRPSKAHAHAGGLDEHVEHLRRGDPRLVDEHGPNVLAVGRDHRHRETGNAHVERRHGRAVHDAQPHALAGSEQARPIGGRRPAIDEVRVRVAADVCELRGRHAHASPCEPLVERRPEAVASFTKSPSVRLPSLK